MRRGERRREEKARGERKREEVVRRDKRDGRERGHIGDRPVAVVLFLEVTNWKFLN